MASHAQADTNCVSIPCIGTWVGKVLADMKGKASPGGNQTLEEMKLFLYSAVRILVDY